MSKFALLAGLLFVSFSAMAEPLSCEDLKAQIDAKLQAKGVQSYHPADSLAASAAKEDAAKTKAPSVVGSCDGGTKRITYKRG